MSSRDYNAPLWDTAEELNRNDCFNDLAYRNMTFDRDDRPEHLLSKAARAYAENFQPAMEQHGISVFSPGNVDSSVKSAPSSRQDCMRRTAVISLSESYLVCF